MLFFLVFFLNKYKTKSLLYTFTVYFCVYILHALFTVLRHTHNIRDWINVDEFIRSVFFSYYTLVYSVFHSNGNAKYFRSVALDWNEGFFLRAREYYIKYTFRDHLNELFKIILNGHSACQSSPVKGLSTGNIGDKFSWTA